MIPAGVLSKWFYQHPDHPPKKNEGLYSNDYFYFGKVFESVWQTEEQMTLCLAQKTEF
jgi:hypothetical protein